MPNMIDINDATIKIRSYATKENLEKALVKYGFDAVRYLIVNTADGRWTAVFPDSSRTSPYIFQFSCKGFVSIN